MVLYSLTVYVFFYLFSSFYVPYVLSISRSSSFDMQCKLEGGKRIKGNMSILTLEILRLFVMPILFVQVK